MLPSQRESLVRKMRACEHFELRRAASQQQPNGLRDSPPPNISVLSFGAMMSSMFDRVCVLALTILFTGERCHSRQQDAPRECARGSA
jgi:hypothetical protein